MCHHTWCVCWDMLSWGIEFHDYKWIPGPKTLVWLSPYQQIDAEVQKENPLVLIRVNSGYINFRDPQSVKHQHLQCRMKISFKSSQQTNRNVWKQSRELCHSLPSISGFLQLFPPALLILQSFITETCSDFLQWWGTNEEYDGTWTNVMKRRTSVSTAQWESLL